MKRLLTALATLALVMPLFGLVTQTSSAADAAYRIAVFKQWDAPTLDVLIVPPHHGQVFNGNGPLGGGDPGEATPINSYLRAVEDSIAAWNVGVATFGSEGLRSSFDTNPYVVGRDTIPQSALEDPEIVITSSEHKGHILGVAVNTGGNHCLINNSMFWTASYTYEDMYNISLHEFGHCLGDGHIVSEQPTHDVMFPTYNDTVGAKGNHLHCISNLNVMALEVAFGPPLISTEIPSPEIPASQYATTCSGPSGVAGPAATSTAPAPQQSSSPSPAPASPSPTPSQSSAPPPEDPPPNSTEPADVFRGIELSLRRHLVASGAVASNNGHCTGAVSVAVEKRRGDRWQIISSTETNEDGYFRLRLKDRSGRYRARVDEGFTADGGRCNAAVSRVLRHAHS